MRQGPGGGQVLPGQRTGPGSTRQTSGIGGPAGQAGCMSERSAGRRAEQAGGDVRGEIAAVVGRAREAARAIEHYSQEQVDELVTAVAWAVVRKDHAEALARQAVDEGGFGNYADKVAKINKRVIGVLADMSGQRTVGVVEELPDAGLVKIAKPVGVVAALIPTTGPDATPPVKTLFALKGRNAIICAPHPRTQGATEAVVGFMRAACEQVGAPADLVQSLPAPSLPKTQELMRQADLVVATGGAGMVRAAYSSGTPAYGVGVGNAVHVVDETADLADAAAAIMTAKTFDYATSCLADNTVIVHADTYDELLRRLTWAGSASTPAARCSWSRSRAPAPITRSAARSCQWCWRSTATRGTSRRPRISSTRSRATRGSATPAGSTPARTRTSSGWR